MSSNGIQLVCFDVGGVLIRICRSWAEGCAIAGLPVRGDPFAEDPSSANGRRDIGQRYQTGRLTCQQYFGDLSKSVGGLYTPDEIQRIHDAWLISEYDGASALVERIHDAGIATAALSNTNHGHWSRMPEFPVMTRLQRLLASHELGLAKPDEAIYREAERRLGVSGSGILFFDDMPENIDAAQRIGWRTARIDPAGDTARQIEAALREHRVL